MATLAETTVPRIDWNTFHELVPEMYRGLSIIGLALKESGIEPELLELIKIRASQLNSCAFCVQYHLNEARKLNTAPEKLDLLTAWRDMGTFTLREQAALAWTERVTLEAQQHISDEDFAAVSAQFSKREVALLTTAIGQINFWNRIAAPFRFTPPIPSREA